MNSTKMLALFRQALLQTNKNSAAPLVSERRFNQEAPKSNIPDDVNSKIVILILQIILTSMFIANRKAKSPQQGGGRDDRACARLS